MAEVQRMGVSGSLKVFGLGLLLAPLAHEFRQSPKLQATLARVRGEVRF